MSSATDRAPARQQSFTAAERQQLRRRLLAWFAGHARDLPWRRSRDPYRVWVSEVMLQQTQVATVREYFERFVAAFPDVGALAAADEQQVLRLWEGMGYYRRARQMHAAARQIVGELGGRFPPSAADLRALPGIGRYTAGAIASIAYGERVPILEANTIRLLSRLVAYRDDPLKSAGQRLLWQVAEEILPRSRAAEFNQALMELGSLVCTPTAPRCGECPLASVCAARAAGLVSEIPRAKPPRQYTELREAAVVVRRDGQILLRQCEEGQRWAGLWDFPRFELEAAGPLQAHQELADKVFAQTGVLCAPGPLLRMFKHGVTRYRITLDCYTAGYVSGRAKRGGGAAVRWVDRRRLAGYPLSTTGRKIAALAT